MKRLLALLLLLMPVSGSAMTALFYQPQSGDRAVAADRWPALFATVRAQGFDTLVVQWTAHGDVITGNLAFAPDDAAGHAWMQARLGEARAAGLQLVLGLAADDKFFVRQEIPVHRLDGYLQRLHARNRQIMAQWRAELGNDAITGWYLPLEIDDRRWRAEDARAPLHRYLQREVDAAGGLPVYVSTFFAGNMAPDEYAMLLRQLADSGVRLWVQDGAGTGKLGKTERWLYLAPVQRCESDIAHGIIYELFRQTAPDAAFAAQPVATDSAHGLLAQRAPCDKNSLFFELRYLPAINGALPLH